MSDRTHLFEAVRAALTMFNIPDDLIRPDATLEELDMDSLALAEFILILQERTGVKVEAEDATKATTLTEIVAYLQARQTETVATP
ncbi:acyl carrier protein [Streptomyces fulvorobeus]|uniref:Acyl carrier protein n=1 Tax=Streptomyces fulvorobeus TaxID=284028 RepID=A0A7J0C353_9ACTN|nr:phosphopantetheine-binding protein [Streptomyces fulvorobeus]NYE40625.1 acyl carrier protein [Streptomyces fulvorobeus]GFM96922.1 hypothetical protein Sfulv_17330 [Streptomyces fulvorobeus]